MYLKQIKEMKKQIVRKVTLLSFMLMFGAFSTFAQNGGMFGKGQGGNYDSYNSKGMLDVSISGNDEGGITNGGIGEETPLGGGIAILLAAGLGYAALKKKED